MLECDICGKVEHLLRCPIHQACPEAVDGRCRVYGYCLNILGKSEYKKNYLTFCIHYAWRIGKLIDINEFKMSTSYRCEKWRSHYVNETKKVHPEQEIEVEAR